MSLSADGNRATMALMKCLVLFASLWMANMASAANLTDTNSTPGLERQLAERILADQTLRDVHQRARTLLKSGLNAGSGYGEVWIRDLNTFIEVALEVNEPARFREALMTFDPLEHEPHRLG